MEWETHPDVVILRENNYNIALPSLSNIDYKNAILAKKMISKYIVNKENNCKEKACYKLYKKSELYYLFVKN